MIDAVGNQIQMNDRVLQAEWTGHGVRLDTDWRVHGFSNDLVLIRHMTMDLGGFWVEPKKLAVVLNRETLQ